MYYQFFFLITRPEIYINSNLWTISFQKIWDVWYFILEKAYLQEALFDSVLALLLPAYSTRYLITNKKNFSCVDVALVLKARSTFWWVLNVHIRPQRNQSRFKHSPRASSQRLLTQTPEKTNHQVHENIVVCVSWMNNLRYLLNQRSKSHSKRFSLWFEEVQKHEKKRRGKEYLWWTNRRTDGRTDRQSDL